MDSVYLLRKIIYSRQNWHILLKLSKTLLELHCLHNYKACWLVDFQVTRGQSTTALTRQLGGGGGGVSDSRKGTSVINFAQKA